MRGVVWTPDDCYDPVHREAYVKVGERTWRLHMTISEAYGFQAYHVPYDGFSVHCYSVQDIPR